MNVKLLRQIQRRIAKEPKQFFMNWFFKTDRRIPNCHTAACIAGWALTLTKTKTKRPSDALKRYGSNGGYFNPARDALSLSEEEANNLFVEERWPAKFYGGPRTLAKRAIARIEHMIKTGE